MPRRQTKYPEKPWIPDQKKWAKHLREEEQKPEFPLEPKDGWQLWDWRTLDDASQVENSSSCK